MYTYDTFDIHRAVVTRITPDKVYVTIPSMSGPNVEIGATYDFPPPSVGEQVWVGATLSFDKMFLITQTPSTIDGGTP
jgi:hypothetical protein